jgi:hypothetical protein
MSKERHFPPEHAKEQFHCPHCGVYAKQFWAHITAGYVWGGYNSIQPCEKFNESLGKEWTISKCEHCRKNIIWLEESIVYPKEIQVVQPNTDLNPDIQVDYLEAANVLADSPRAAAAILRLALQKLCKQLGEKGENINADIASLVKKGLNPSIQKSLDALRITGNNAVHPGALDLTEDPGRVIKLFGLVNFIAEKMLSEPKEIDSFYEDLPDSSKEAVDKRDTQDRFE